MALEAVVYHHHQQQDPFGQTQSNNEIPFESFLHPLLFDNNTWASCTSSSFDYLLDTTTTTTTTQSSSETIIDDFSYNYTSNHHLCDDYNYNYNQNYSSNYDYDYDYPLINAPAHTARLDDQQQQWQLNPNSSSSQEVNGVPETERPKRRRRARAMKNNEEIENQRMTHIAVERNRRKQMNDYLSALRSLMPDSYVQRGDQASIIGGAINFVKELEQNLQCLSAKKHTNENANTGGSGASSLPFSEFFAFPQYSGTTGNGGNGGGRGVGDGGSGGSGLNPGDNNNDDDHAMKSSMSHRLNSGGGSGGGVAADVEVTMVESHALLKIRTKRPPKQLSKLVVGLQGLRLTILHLNVSKVDGVAFYSFSVKVEEESKMSSVDEIAGAVYQLLGRLQEEAGSYF